MTPKLTLQQLIKQAGVEHEPPPRIVATGPAPKPEAKKLRKQATSRLLGQAYLRTGCDLKAAFREVFPEGAESTFRWEKIPDLDAFTEEIAATLNASEVTQAAAMNVLWTVVQSSVLDFLDDNGRVLPIDQLRKLPRVMHTVLSEIKVTVQQTPVRDASGEPMLDDMGKPYQSEKSFVHIKLLDKLVAVRQLAEIMKLVGPSSVVHTHLNIGEFITAADARARRLGRTYEEGAETDAGAGPLPVPAAGASGGSGSHPWEAGDEPQDVAQLPQ